MARQRFTRLGAHLTDVAPVDFAEPEGARAQPRPLDALTIGLLGLGALGLAARVFVLASSEGSNDMRTWLEFAQLIHQTSVGNAYDTHRLFNHPPLMGLFASWAYGVHLWSGLRFEWLFKLPMVLADLGSAALLFQNWKPRGQRWAACGFALFCCNPASILITAYHGNTDALCASLMLLAAVLMDRRWIFRSGLALAASINVKLIPVLLILPLLACVQGRKQAVRFVAGLSLGVVPFLPYLIGHWAGFYTHALAYRSQAGVWGVTFISKQIAGLKQVGGLGKAVYGFWRAKGTLFVLLWPVLLATLRRTRRPYLSARELTACTMLAFLVFAQGFDIQSLVSHGSHLLAVSLGQGA